MRSSKGKHIEYKNLEMAQYLSPNNSKLTIADKKLFFSIKNRMVKIPDNFRGKMTQQQVCVTGCGQRENMSHIYDCEILNGEKKGTNPYETIYNGTLTKQVTIYYPMKERQHKRDKYV